MSKSLFELKPHDCRYLTGNRFCAERVMNSATSFCEEHHRRCYQVTSAKRAPSPISLPVDKLPPPAQDKATNNDANLIADVMELWK